MRTKAQLFRVVRTADGRAQVDPSMKADGRGAYLCRSRECLRRAVKSRGFERSLKMRIPESCIQELEGMVAAGEGRRPTESKEMTESF